MADQRACSYSFFEGTEKKVELAIDPSLPSLLELGDEVWAEVVGAAGAAILSRIEDDHCRAYVLSESSLFVFSHKLILITCGRTRLPAAVTTLLDRIPPDKIRLFIYERKNELFPHRQPTSFFEDVELLNERLPGRAFRFGGEDGHHLYLFHLDRPYQADGEDVTLEMLMYGLAASTRELFQPRGESTAASVREAARLGRLLPDSKIDDHLFSPAGYSLNAIRDDHYLTLHVTPEEGASYASLETNHRLDGDLDRTLDRVLELFRPRSFDLILWEAGAPNMLSREGYRVRSRVDQRLSCGYRVSFASFYRPTEAAESATELDTARCRATDAPVNGAGLQEASRDWPHAVEETHQEILGLRYNVKHRLFSGRSEFQKVEIFETRGFGRMLFNDDVAMISERDEFVYHEMIAHVPLFVHPDPRRVLVIGGGDGGTVREIVRHPSVEHCRLVEIDALVIDGCREHIPQTSAGLDDPRVTVTVADGVRFVAETEERYDLVIVDSTDPVGPAAPLFGREFYSNVERILNDGGIAISQAESPFYEEECQRSMLAILREVFDRVHLYNYVNITYPGGLWSFTFSVRGDLCPIGDFEPERVRGSGLRFEYYSPEVHRAAFVHPTFQSRRLGELLTPLKKPIDLG